MGRCSRGHINVDGDTNGDNNGDGDEHGQNYGDGNGYNNSDTNGNNDGDCNRENNVVNAGAAQDGHTACHPNNCKSTISTGDISLSIADFLIFLHPNQ